MYDFIIIGSGPASISCSLALTGKNKKIAVIDYGKNIEETKTEEIKKILEEDPNLEDSKSTNKIKAISKTNNYEESCYIGKNYNSVEFNTSLTVQDKNIQLMGLDQNSASDLEKYCKYTK